MVKKHLLTTAALLLLMPNPALAQHEQHGQGGGGRGGGQQGRPSQSRPTPPQGRPAMRPPQGGGGGSHNRPSRPETRPTPPQGGNRPSPGRPPNPGHGNRPSPGRPNPGHGNRPSPGRPPFRPGAGRPPNFRPVHGSPFRYPHGYRYRRWSVGLLLPSLFLSSTYYYNDYDSLGVGPPPPGYHWVRYGPDLLLVQYGTRRIADVIYGAFY